MSVAAHDRFARYDAPHLAIELASLRTCRAERSVWPRALAFVVARSVLLLARTGSRTRFGGIGPAFPFGRVSGFADRGVDGRRSLCTSWLRQRQSVERSLRTECAANRVQFAAGCRAGTSSVGGLSAMPGERHLAVAARGRQVPWTSGVGASVRSQSSQDYFPSPPKGA